MLTGCFAPANQKTTEHEDENTMMQILKQREEDEEAMLPKFVRLMAEDVRLRRECNSGKALLSEPDYVKVPICDKCHAGETFLALPLPQGQSLPKGAGEGIYTCSACGSGALVIKMSSEAQRESCAEIPELERREKEAQQGAGVNSEVFAIARQHAENWYDCNAGDQQACRNGCTGGMQQACQMVK